jgi:hypothetical protein
VEEREVTRTAKDQRGNITALCNHRTGWRRSTADAVNDIERLHYAYYVEAQTPRAYVIVVNTKPKSLRTTADATSRNNLDKLPDC